MWSLFNKKNEALKPKVFTNGKSQEDIVKEALDEIKKGNKIIFIHGVCGSGKSAIALNIAKELGKASIVVPIKNLQRQYESDYMHDKYLLKNNNEKLKIDIITGRKNHPCQYLKENSAEMQDIKKSEKNANLYDIFENKKQDTPIFNKDESADNYLLPCKIEIKEKNISLIKKYHRNNPEIKDNRHLDLKKMKRFAVAPACAYWCPILSENTKLKLDCEKKFYNSLSGKHCIYLRKPGCSYYNQFKAYSDSEVIIFNSDQYLLETALGRKPLTEVEIIDECDEFLDNFVVEGSINLDRLYNELLALSYQENQENKIINSLLSDINKIKNEARTFSSEDIKPLNETIIPEFIKAVVNNDLFYENRDDESYIEHTLEVARDFYPLIEDSYLSFSKDKKNNLYLKLVTVYLEKRLNELISKNKAFIFMSATLHSEKVLRDIFGIKNFKIINAEIMKQGAITIQKTGLERDFSYENFSKSRVTRQEYLKALDKCVEIAKRPTLVHVNAFSDLPSFEEKQKYDLNNLVVADEFILAQNEDKEGNLVKDFKDGKNDLLFTTRCNRGLDFPFEVCNSVIITKFPYPNIQSTFWRILKKNKPSLFWDFYKDKAHRSLLQRIYRSVRDVKDHVFLLSPDLRVLETDIIN